MFYKLTSIGLASFLFVATLFFCAHSAQAIEFDTSGAKAAILEASDRPTDAFQSPIKQVIVNIINYILGFLGLVAVAFVVYAGFLMVTAGGEEEAIEKGKKIITYAAVGIIIIFMSYAIVQMIANVKNTVT